MSNDVRRTDYSDGFADGYNRGRADAERDFQNSDYWNDYIAYIKKQTRANAIKELMVELYPCRYKFNDNCMKCSLRTICKSEYLENELIKLLE